MPALADYLTVAEVDPAGRRCRLEHGQFNDVVIVGEDMALRFPRTASALAELPRVARLLRSLDVGSSIPRTLFERTNGSLGAAFLAMTYVAGEPWNSDCVVCVADFATLLERMSTVDSPDLAAAPDWPAFAAEVRRHLFPMMSRAGRARAAAELDGLLALTPGRATLVHGDLGGDNLRFIDGRLVGVLDWDEAHLGDPAADLASIAVTVGWEAAGRIAPDRVPAARAYAATFALQQALPAWHAGDDENLTDGLAGYLG